MSFPARASGGRGVDYRGALAASGAVGASPLYSRARPAAVGLGVALASPRWPMISLTSVTRDSLEAFTVAVFRALGLTRTPIFGGRPHSLLRPGQAGRERASAS